MKIHYRYEPDMAKFWIGVTNGVCYQEYGLQSWMTVEDVISILRKAEEEVAKH